MKKTVFFSLFIFILLLSAVLRFYQLGEVPPGPNRDEASIGYTAYSLLQTGKDEYGRSYPLSFQSFGDWKLPFYIYITEVFIKVLGLTSFAIRLPSALFGIASVALTFFLAKKLSQNTSVALFSMFFMAVSPWSVHFSRVASEANTAVFLILSGTLLLFKGLEKQKYLVISAVFFASTYATYAGNYIFTTLLVLGMGLLYKEELFKKRSNFFAVFVFLFISFCIGFINFSANTTKISGIGIFGNPAIVHAEIEIPRNNYVNPQSFFARLFYNRISFAAERFVQNYLMSFSPEFLFIKGGENRAHNIAHVGNMHLVDIFPFVLGFVYLLFQKKNKEVKLVLWWFFIAPIAASITKDAPHSARMLAILPIIPYVCAIGTFWFVSFISQYYKKFASIIVIGLFFAYAYSVGVYLDRYYVQFPKNEADAWGIGYQALNTIVTNPENSGKRIIMTKPEYSPYIFLLFYQKYNPVQYQKEAVIYPPTPDGFYHVKAFNRYEFREIDWEKDVLIPETLLVSDVSSLPEDIKKNFSVSYIFLPDQTSMFAIVKTK